MERGEEALVKESKQKDALYKRLLEREATESKKAEESRELKDALMKAESDPIRLRRQGETTQKALAAMNAELNQLVLLKILMRILN